MEATWKWWLLAGSPRLNVDQLSNYACPGSCASFLGVPNSRQSVKPSNINHPFTGQSKSFAVSARVSSASRATRYYHSRGRGRKRVKDGERRRMEGGWSSILKLTLWESRAAFGPSTWDTKLGWLTG